MIEDGQLKPDPEKLRAVLVPETKKGFCVLLDTIGGLLKAMLPSQYL